MPQNKHNLSALYTCNVQSFEISLSGDGSTTPLLVVQADGNECNTYVEADDLRKIAKQLKKWAKGLEQHDTPD